MDVIITAVGQSLRFKNNSIDIPKYLLEFDNKTVIEHTINLFDYTDSFHVIFNKLDFKKYQTRILNIKNRYKKINFYSINSHNLGPVYSLLEVKELLNIKGPVIISYNDFLVKWDYEKFKREVHGFHGAIPCFSGFHPSSLGKTLFGYVKKNKKNLLIDIKEKKSFTRNPINEEASCGLYYFKSFKLFKEYAEILIQKKSNKINNEYYVSLVFKEMIKKKLLIYVSKINKFICLGTPDHYNKFKFWHDYFKEKSSKNYCYNQINLIPLAGMGERFKIKKYKVPKPFIPIENNPMIITSCKSLPKTKNWIFLIHKKHLKKYPIERKLKKEFFGRIIPVNKNTAGQLATCYLAKGFLRKEKPLFISSCDYKVIFSHKKLQNIINDKTVDGIIWTTKLKNIYHDNANNFAYCKIINNRISEIIEKETISDNPLDDLMVLGCFWYRSCNDFLESAENAFKKNIMVNNEFYVGKSINYLIKKKKKRFVNFNVDYWISFGNPFELDIFHYWEDYFVKSE